MENNNFTKVFNATLSQLEVDAKAAGSNLTEVCREAGVSRTTPDRWKAKPPATVALVTKMQNVVAEKAAAKAQAAPVEPGAPVEPVAPAESAAPAAGPAAE